MVVIFPLCFFLFFFFLFVCGSFSFIIIMFRPALRRGSSLLPPSFSSSLSSPLFLSPKNMLCFLPLFLFLLFVPFPFPFPIFFFFEPLFLFFKGFFRSTPSAQKMTSPFSLKRHIIPLPFLLVHTTTATPPPPTTTTNFLIWLLHTKL